MDNYISLGSYLRALFPWAEELPTSNSTLFLQAVAGQQSACDCWQTFLIKRWAFDLGR